MSFSVIVPACNEEGYLEKTLASIQTARAFASDQQIEVIVVDNASTDRTRSIAAAAGATVLTETMRNVGRARNTGAASAVGNWFVFIDADTLVPEDLFFQIAALIRDGRCLGGAAVIQHRSNRIAVRFYLQFWRVVGAMLGLAQGAAQFCSREAFAAVGGYDESLWMGEDADFYWRLKRFAKRNRAHVHLSRHFQVYPSSRRFDLWPVWRILLFTNPLFIVLFRRRRAAWKGWYDELVR